MPLIPAAKIGELFMYTSTDQPLPEGKLYQFYRCGICDHYHSIQWDGDCREDGVRFQEHELDEKYGAFGWECVAMPGGEEDTFENVRAEPARPFDSKPSWRGLYRVAGEWRCVANQAGGLILYASEQAALDGAMFMLSQVRS